MRGILFLMFSLVVLHVQTDALLFGSDRKDQVRLARSGLEFEPDATLMNINNISMWVHSDGLSSNAPGVDSGVVFPRGAGGVVFVDGIVWGGMVEDGAEPVVRVGGQTHSTGLVPGRILSAGQAENFTAPSVNRVWRIRRDCLTADLARDAAEFFLKDTSEVSTTDVELVRNRYARDWLDWPWQKGAPFYDAEGDGVYSPRFRSDGSPMLFPEADEPGLANADQVVWFVANDLDPGTVQTLFGSPAIGLEVQTTLWAFTGPEPLGNVIFKRYRFLYKGAATSSDSSRIDSLHFAQWSDTDIGSFGDDFIGSDLAFDVGYGYNSTNVDQVFGALGLPIPAAGYDLLSGPMVRHTDGGEEAIFDLKKRPGFTRLPMTTFGSVPPSDGDPSRGGDYNQTLQWWNMLRGYRPRPENPPTPWVAPGGSATKFLFTGDPVTGTGFIDSNPGDRRMYLASGPINMSLGDSNEVYIALIGGQGADHLLSISALKYTSRAAQSAFDVFFKLPHAPPVPNISATELDQEILLNWGRQEEVEHVERSINGYDFEGYNVYQLPSADAALAEGVKVATFDRINGVRLIPGEKLDPLLGVAVPFVAQSGSDSGVFRTMTVKKDLLQGLDLINGTAYHFAVTAYNHRREPVLGIRTMESAPAVVSVTPQSLSPGQRLTAAIGDTVPVDRISGTGDGRVQVFVADPTKLTGGSYKVTFLESSNSELTWNLVNISVDTVLLAQKFNPDDSLETYQAEGFQVAVTGKPLQGISWSHAGPGGIPGNTRWISRAPSDSSGSPGGLVFGAAYLGNQFVGSGLGRGDFKDVHWDWYPKESFTDLNGNGKYDIGEPYQLTVGDGHQKASLSSTWGPGNYEGFFDVPWAVFDSEADPPRQLQCTVHDPDRNQQWDLDIQYLEPASPNFVNVYGGDFRFNYIFVLDADYDATGASHDPAQEGDDFFATVLDGTQNIQWVGWFGRRGSREPLGAAFRLYLEAPNVLTPEDVFTFSTSAPTFDKATARLDVLSQVNVFPNPYLGPFNLSTRFDKGFVTFTHLPPQATVRIFTLAGAPVRKLEKMDEGQFLKWDLRNEFERFVGTGIYLAHVEMPELGVSKVLKLMVVPQ